MAARSPVSGVMFSGQGFAMRKLNKYPHMQIDLKNFLAGLFAGFCYTNVAFIFDLLKVRAQENKG